MLADPRVFPPPEAADPRSRALHALAAQALEASTGAVADALQREIAAAPWEAILDAAKKARCDAVVMASHGRRGVAALLLGSETQKVLTHSKTPVLVCR